MNVASLMNVVQSNCDLQNRVENPFGVKVLVLISEESLRNPVSKVFAFDPFHEDQLFALCALHLEGLGNMNVVADIDPLFNLVFQELLFVSAGYFLVGFVVKH